MARGGRERSPGGDPGARRDVELLYGIHPVLEALRARRRRLLALRLRSGSARPELAPLLEAARAAGVRIEQVSAGALAEGLAAEVNHQGVVLAAGPLPSADLSALARGAAPRRACSSPSTRSKTPRTSVRSRGWPRPPERPACC